MRGRACCRLALVALTVSLIAGQSATAAEEAEVKSHWRPWVSADASVGIGLGARSGLRLTVWATERVGIAAEYSQLRTVPRIPPWVEGESCSRPAWVNNGFRVGAFYRQGRGLVHPFFGGTLGVGHHYRNYFGTSCEPGGGWPAVYIVAFTASASAGYLLDWGIFFVPLWLEGTLLGKDSAMLTVNLAIGLQFPPAPW